MSNSDLDQLYDVPWKDVDYPTLDNDELQDAFVRILNDSADEFSGGVDINLPSYFIALTYNTKNKSTAQAKIILPPLDNLGAELKIIACRIIGHALVDQGHLPILAIWVESGMQEDGFAIAFSGLTDDGRAVAALMNTVSTPIGFLPSDAQVMGYTGTDPEQAGDIATNEVLAFYAGAKQGFRNPGSSPAIDTDQVSSIRILKISSKSDKQDRPEVTDGNGTENKDKDQIDDDQKETPDPDDG